MLEIIGAVAILLVSLFVVARLFLSVSRKKIVHAIRIRGGFMSLPEVDNLVRGIWMGQDALDSLMLDGSLVDGTLETPPFLATAGATRGGDKGQTVPPTPKRVIFIPSATRLYFFRV